MSQGELNPELRLVRPEGVRGRLTLRVGKPSVAQPPASPLTPPAGPPVEMGPTDPRWVLAVRTSQVLAGAVLRPSEREGLIEVGRVMGLTTFDSNLVISIVQDQARRGLGPGTAANLLSMVPLRPTDGSGWRVARWCLAAIAIEAAVLAYVL